MSKDRREEIAVRLLANAYRYCEQYGIDREHMEDAAEILFQENVENGNANRLAA